MKLAIKGIITGFIIVLPGMSGGTLLLLMGLYEELMRDLSKLRLLPWLPFAGGVAGGILISGVVFSWLLASYTPLVMAFLLGCILASIKAVLGEHYRPDFRRLALFIVGTLIGLVLAGEPMGLIEDSVRPGFGLLLIGGALACTTMILPGVPGSSVLIILGIYDDMFKALADLDWVVLVTFALGAVIGVFALSNVLNRIYSRYRISVSWLFSGLIIGSARVLIPTSLNNPIMMVVLAAGGFALVWWWGEK